MTREKMLEKAAEAGREWMKEVIALGKWDLTKEITYNEFSQALCEANDPPFPPFETEGETEEAFDAAFEQLQSAQKN
jgi:superfamily I DNA and RNA helicase